jgi:hypothetical protein
MTRPLPPAAGKTRSASPRHHVLDQMPSIVLSSSSDFTVS